MRQQGGGEQDKIHVDDQSKHGFESLGGVGVGGRGGGGFLCNPPPAVVVYHV